MEVEEHSQPSAVNSFHTTSMTTAAMSGPFTIGRVRKWDAIIASPVTTMPSYWSSSTSLCRLLMHAFFFFGCSTT
jgi:hypothetical protein